MAKQTRAQAEKAYEEAKVQADKTCEEAKVQARESYGGVKAQADRAYEKVIVPALKTYREFKAKADNACQKSKAQAWESYQEAIDRADSKRMCCEKHPKEGIIIISSGEQMCYGCWLEQFDYCPLCGKPWNNHPPEGVDCRTEKEVEDG